MTPLFLITLSDSSSFGIATADEIAALNDLTAYTIRHFSRQGALALHRAGVEVLSNQGPTYRYRRNGEDLHGSMSDIFAIIDGRV